jgi:hypothetical protein
LAEESILSDDFLRELMNVGEVDILVGLPSYNHAATVGQVVQTIRAGLLQFFPRKRAVIINVDGGSTDGTQDLVRAASINDLGQSNGLRTLRTFHSISTSHDGGPSSGKAIHTLLAAADLLQASTCAIFAPDSTSIEPTWVERLLQPVLHDGQDLVLPLYRRHKFDGLLVRNLVYPMTRAVFGERLREPYPSDFAFSGGLGAHFFGLDNWSNEVGCTGVELLLTISAVTNQFKVAQTFLGTKLRVENAPADLVPAMRQTVGPLFWSLDQQPANWTEVAEARPVPTTGPESEVSLDPLRINRERMHEMFATGVSGLEPVLKSILRAPTLTELQRVAALPDGESRLSNDLWVRTVYEFAASYHQAVISRDHIIQALASLYRGKTYSFIVQNENASGEEVEANVEDLCQTFEHLKPYLLELWNGGK